MIKNLRPPSTQIFMARTHAFKEATTAEKMVPVSNASLLKNPANNQSEPMPEHGLRPLRKVGDVYGNYIVTTRLEATPVSNRTLLQAKRADPYTGSFIMRKSEPMPVPSGISKEYRKLLNLNVLPAAYALNKGPKKIELAFLEKLTNDNARRIVLEFMQNSLAGSIYKPLRLISSGIKGIEQNSQAKEAYDSAIQEMLDLYQRGVTQGTSIQLVIDKFMGKLKQIYNTINFSLEEHLISTDTEEVIKSIMGASHEIEKYNGHNREDPNGPASLEQTNAILSDILNAYKTNRPPDRASIEQIVNSEQVVSNGLSNIANIKLIDPLAQLATENSVNKLNEESKELKEAEGPTIQKITGYEDAPILSESDFKLFLPRNLNYTTNDKQNTIDYINQLQFYSNDNDIIVKKIEDERNIDNIIKDILILKDIINEKDKKNEDTIDDQINLTNFEYVLQNKLNKDKEARKKFIETSSMLPVLSQNKGSKLPKQQQPPQPSQSSKDIIKNEPDMSNELLNNPDLYYDTLIKHKNMNDYLEYTFRQYDKLSKNMQARKYIGLYNKILYESYKDKNIPFKDQKKQVGTLPSNFDNTLKDMYKKNIYTLLSNIIPEQAEDINEEEEVPILAPSQIEQTEKEKAKLERKKAKLERKKAEKAEEERLEKAKLERKKARLEKKKAKLEQKYEPIQDEPIQDEPIQDEPIQDEPIQEPAEASSIELNDIGKQLMSIVNEEIVRQDASINDRIRNKNRYVYPLYNQNELNKIFNLDVNEDKLDKLRNIYNKVRENINAKYLKDKGSYINYTISNEILPYVKEKATDRIERLIKLYAYNLSKYQIIANKLQSGKGRGKKSRKSNKVPKLSQTKKEYDISTQKFMKQGRAGKVPLPEELTRPSSALARGATKFSNEELNRIIQAILSDRS
jgi:hypothetical protein